MQDASFNPERLGIHYFADGEHFGSTDLARWLPKIKSLGFRWITLRAPQGRAIPEDFLRGLHEAHLRPIVHLPLSLQDPPHVEEIDGLLQAYANWGVRYVAFFDRPNMRAAWPDSGWTQRGLVERFLNAFVPLAEAAIDAGLCPVFPPLQPGGDYWDTAFLRSALEQMLANGEDDVVEQMAIGAYAWAQDKALDWGAGGPESWPATLPYFTPEHSEDQRGFRIFDWYNAIARATAGKELPTLILGAGDHASGSHSPAKHARRFVEMGRECMLTSNEESLRGIPANVVACNFWLLAAPEGAEEADCAWFGADGRPRPVVAQWLAWKQGQGAPAAKQAGTLYATGLAG